MFVFIISLRHPDNANDFSQVEKLLTITLSSICGQIDENFRIVVVCNQLPHVTISDERIFYHVVNFPVPSKEKSSALSAEPKFKDKGTKYMAGLLFAKQFNPDYVYIVDSDDWVNINLITYLKSQPNYAVWYVDKGYIVNYQLKEYKRISGLSRYCGSTFVYDYNFLMGQANLNTAVDEHATQDELIQATSEFFLLKLMCNHTINYKHFKSIGFKPKGIPLRTSCWIQGTGENVSGTAGGASGLPIDEKFCATFNLSKHLISSKNKNVVLEVRDGINSIRSSYSWLMSRVTGQNRF